MRYLKGKIVVFAPGRSVTSKNSKIKTILNREDAHHSLAHLKFLRKGDLLISFHLVGRLKG